MSTLRRTRISFSILGILTISAAALATEPGDPPRPLVVAHRGLLLHAPENTLANFRACLELRLGFEFDVQRTRDGHLVCIHDETLDRTTNGTGPVAQYTLADIKKLDAGRWFAPRFAGEKVPTTEEVLALMAKYRRRNIILAVDLKANDVAQDVVRLAERYDVLDHLLFIGNTISDPAIRKGIRKVNRHAHTAAVANNSEEFQSALDAADADWVYVRFVPSAEQVKAVHQADKRVFIAGSTVSGHQADNWQQATQSGLDAILTDYSLELSATLREQP